MIRYDVVAVGIKTNIVRLISEGKTREDSLAIEKMAIARRGVNEEFFVTTPAGQYKDGDRWRGARAYEPDDTKPGATTTELPPLALAENFGDHETLLNSRDWLQKALEDKGAKIIGGGCGAGSADLCIVLEGCEFNVSIRPIQEKQE